MDSSLCSCAAHLEMDSFVKYIKKEIYNIGGPNSLKGEFFILFVKQYIFSCNVKYVQKLDFLVSVQIIADRFLVQKFLL